MSSRARKEPVSHPRLSFKISFFQDMFTIIEELTGDCPGVGLPDSFRIDNKEYVFFKKLQSKYNITKMFITNLDKVKKLNEWGYISGLIDRYKQYWDKHKSEIIKTKEKLSKDINFGSFLEKLELLAKKRWITKNLNVFLTMGYKNSGTYDREINVIRLGIHKESEEYLIYTLYHELIHFHIVNHLKMKLKEDKEEILCRAIFKNIFKKDPTAQKHWKVNLNKNEINEINKKEKNFNF